MRRDVDHHPGYVAPLLGDLEVGGAQDLHDQGGVVGGECRSLELGDHRSLCPAVHKRSEQALLAAALRVHRGWRHPAQLGDLLDLRLRPPAAAGPGPAQVLALLVVSSAGRRPADL
jgi:hypothetical protein